MILACLRVYVKEDLGRLYKVYTKVFPKRQRVATIAGSGV